MQIMGNELWAVLVFHSLFSFVVFVGRLVSVDGCARFG